MEGDKNTKTAENRRRLLSKESSILTRSTNSGRASERLSKDQKEQDEPVVRFSKMDKLGEAWERPLVFPRTGGNRNVATVEWQDLERLDDDQFLNDNLIYFGLRWFLEHTAPAVSDQVYCFNTYFYNSLTNGVRKGINYDAVKRWTSKLTKENLFEFNYIVVPINESLHWYLAIICNAQNLQFNTSDETVPTDDVQSGRTLTRDLTDKSMSDDSRATSKVISQPATESHERVIMLDGSETPEPAIQDRKTRSTSNPSDPAHELRKVDNSGETTNGTASAASAKLSEAEKVKEPVIIILDSLGDYHPNVTRSLKDYITREAWTKMGKEPIEPRGMTARGIPFQQNSSDCGLYLLAYFQKFLESPHDFVSKTILRRMNVHEDWPKFVAGQIRDGYRDIVLREARRQNGFEVEEDKSGFLKEKFSIISTTRSTDSEVTKTSADSNSRISKTKNGMSGEPQKDFKEGPPALTYHNNRATEAQSTNLTPCLNAIRVFDEDNDNDEEDDAAKLTSDQ